MRILSCDVLNLPHTTLTYKNLSIPPVVLMDFFMGSCVLVLLGLFFQMVSSAMQIEVNVEKIEFLGKTYLPNLEKHRSLLKKILKILKGRAIANHAANVTGVLPAPSGALPLPSGAPPPAPPPKAP